MLSLLAFRLLTTVFHELGHAIPALLLTKEKVTMYLGSHGDPKKSFQFQIGRLECFFRFNLFYWKGGLCVMHAKNVSLQTNFLVTISGPLLSFMIASVVSIFLLYGEFTDVTTLILFALVFSCTLDFLHNIIPSREQVALHDGTVVPNDGAQLIQLFAAKNVERVYEEGVKYYRQQNYQKAAETFESLLELRNDHPVFYRLAILSNIMIGNFSKAKEIQQIFSKHFAESFEALDFINLGRIQLHDKNYEAALKSFLRAQDQNADNEEIQRYIEETQQLMKI